MLLLTGWSDFCSLMKKTLLNKFWGFYVLKHNVNNRNLGLFPFYTVLPGQSQGTPRREGAAQTNFHSLTFVFSSLEEENELSVTCSVLKFPPLKTMKAQN